MIIDRVHEILKRAFNPPVRFADGSFVEWHNREAIAYVEGGRRAVIEFLFDPESRSGAARTLRLSDIQEWERDGIRERLSNVDRERIAAKVRAYCEKKGIPLSVTD